MAHRRDLLGRLLVALAQPGVDGVLSTPDVLEDLLLLGALEGRVAIGSMNRGGLPGAAWELDDRFTAYDADAIARSGLDGGKMLLRLALNDAGTAQTLEGCARAVTALAARRLVAMVEPLPACREANGTVRISKDPDELVRLIGVASGLGTTSAYTWLKIHVTDDIERVLEATTLPTLLLGGDPGERPEEVFEGWKRALRAPQVRGLVAGRALLYPPDGDVAGRRHRRREAGSRVSPAFIGPPAAPPRVRTRWRSRPDPPDGASPVCASSVSRRAGGAPSPPAPPRPCWCP